MNLEDKKTVVGPGALVARFKSDPVLRNNAIYLIGSVLTGGLGYVFHFETGHLLGPSAYAVVASGLAGLYLLSIPVVGIQLVSARYASLAAARGRLHALMPMLLRMTAYSLVGGIPVALGLIIFAPDVARFLNIGDVRIVPVLAVAALVALPITINRGAIQGLRNFVALSVNQLMDMTTRLMTAGALIGLGFGAIGALGALTVGPGVAYAASFLVLRPAPSSGESDGNRFEGFGRYALLATLASIGINYIFSIDTILAKHFLQPDAAGLYAAAAVLARVVYFLGVSITGVMFPEVATLHARNEKHYHVVDVSIGLIAATGVLLIGVYVLAPGLVLFPYGPGFAGARPYLGTFALALTLLAIGNLFINYFLSIARASFVIPLLIACVLETSLIGLFHSGIWQILADVVISLGLLAASMAAMYGSDRLLARRSVV